MFIVPLNRGDKIESFNISKKEEKKRPFKNLEIWEFLIM